MLATYDSAGRLDAGEELFFARQHELIESELYEIRYPELKARSHFSVNFQGGPAISSITYRVLDRYGMAAVGLGFPRVGIKAQERSMGIQPLSVSWGYNFQEIREAQHVGMDLDAAEANVARRKVAELEDRIAYLGDKPSGLIGAFTHPNFPVMVGTVPLIETTPSSQIVAQFRKIISTPKLMSKGVERVNAVLMTETLHSFLEGTPYSDQAPQLTIMDRIKQSHKDVEFDWCNYCDGAGSGGEDIIFAYNRNRENMELRIPHEFEVFPPRIGDKEDYKINAHERYGGLQVRFAVGLIYEVSR
jgi:hypothetical protein